MAGLIRGSLELLDGLFAQWPDPSQLAAGYDQQGICYLHLGDHEAAIQSFRSAIQCERENPRHRTNAFLHFAWQVAVDGRSDLYEEALSLLFEGHEQVYLPIQEYQFSVATALIHDDLGDAEAAHEFAQYAVAAASKQESGIRYHKSLGLVVEPERNILERMQNLAEK
jgi:tetratricopeptide (TPR) repeat protein